MESNQRRVVDMKGQDVFLVATDGDEEPHRFHVDCAYDERSTQEEVFRSLGRSLLETSLQGFNASLVVYGRPLTGKGYTLFGKKDEGGGLLPMLAKLLYATFEKEKIEADVEYSCWEVDDESIYDLLSEDPKPQSLRVRRNAEQGFHVQFLKKANPTSEDELIELLKRTRDRKERRDIRRPAKWHAFYQFSLHLFDPQDPEVVLEPKILVVDLKGVDRSHIEAKTTSSRAGTDTPASLREGARVVKGFTAFGHVVHVLTVPRMRPNAKKGIGVGDHVPFVPFDNSKVTALLRDVLGGNSVTTILASVSPAEDRYHETLDTLEILSKARNIRTNPIRCEKQTEYGSLAKTVVELREETLASDKLAHGHPESEKEERLHRLEAILEKTYQKTVAQGGRRQSFTSQDGSIAEERSPMGLMHSARKGDAFDVDRADELKSGTPFRDIHGAEGDLYEDVEGRGGFDDDDDDDDASFVGDEYAEEGEDAFGGEGRLGGRGDDGDDGDGDDDDDDDDDDGLVLDEEAPLEPPRKRRVPKTHLNWKKRDTMSEKHGDHSAVYVPVKGGGKVHYKGQWRKDKKSGYGVLIDGRFKYEGRFVGDKRTGQGVLYRLNEGKWVREYQGHWLNGKRDGKGTMFYENGEIYEGEFRDGKRDGRGVMYYLDGTKYDGEWREDKCHGWGTLVHQNGDFFEGGWAFGKKEGPGKFFYLSKQKKYEGEWLNDVAKCGTISGLDSMEGGAPDMIGSGRGPSTIQSARGDAHVALPHLEVMHPDMILREEIEALRRKVQDV
eukprot:TRINITY_DN961_c0_g2_i1.p1 TRINITY_DN961_c0_g2~~TRINITY_DN961_c0_g2_i1.p1  ORF type:complete len:834 (+),score=295.53 TRINITY_DN961_c0_g2_i1:160-2502(+)